MTSYTMIEPLETIGKAVGAVKDLSSNIEDGLRHLVRNESGGRSLTRRGRKSNFEGLQAIAREVKQHTPKLTAETEKHFGGRNLDDDERQAVSATVGKGGRQLEQAENIDDLEKVLVDGKDANEVIGNNPDNGMAVASNCKAGYKEFPIDDETSTCVFESLVEDNCYAGSRQPSDVDLGDSGACLYYSLDFPQSDGSCRENYERVDFQGRSTCRWAELGPNQSHLYTLQKPQDDASQCIRMNYVIDRRFTAWVCDGEEKNFDLEITNTCSQNVHLWLDQDPPNGYCGVDSL